MKIILTKPEIIAVLTMHLQETLNSSAIMIPSDIDNISDLTIDLSLIPQDSMGILEDIKEADEDKALENLMQLADTLGVKYRSNISFDTLKERVDAAREELPSAQNTPTINVDDLDDLEDEDEDEEDTVVETETTPKKKSIFNVTKPQEEEEDTDFTEEEEEETTSESDDEKEEEETESKKKSFFNKVKKA